MGFLPARTCTLVWQHPFSGLAAVLWQCPGAASEPVGAVITPDSLWGIRHRSMSRVLMRRWSAAIVMLQSSADTSEQYSCQGIDIHLCSTGSDRGGCKTLVQRKRWGLARRRHRDSNTTPSPESREVGNGGELGLKHVVSIKCFWEKTFGLYGAAERRKNGTKGTAAPRSAAGVAAAHWRPCRAAACTQTRRPGRQCAPHAEPG